MIHALADLFTLRFGIGVLVGIVLQRLAAFAEARYQDHRFPLPAGRRRRIGTLSKVWVVGAVAVTVFAYSLVEMQRLADCQAEFGRVVAERSAITTENDRLSREQRDLLATFAEQESLWLADLLDPPPHIDGLPADNPLRQGYTVDRTRLFFDTAAGIRARIAAISRAQEDHAQQRARNPIPDPTCGRGGSK